MAWVNDEREVSMGKSRDLFRCDLFIYLFIYIIIYIYYIHIYLYPFAYIHVYLSSCQLYIWVPGIGRPFHHCGIGHRRTSVGPSVAEDQLPLQAGRVRALSGPGSD